MADRNGQESGVRDVRARQMGTKADPWRDGNGPAEEDPARTEADWQEPIKEGARPAGTSRQDAGHPEQRVARHEASQLGDLGYKPSANQVRHEPMPASHHADRGDEAAGEGAETGSGG